MELSSYAFLAPEGRETSLSSGGAGNGLAPILLAAAEDTSPGSVERLEHEYALKSELDADWGGATGRANANRWILEMVAKGNSLAEILDSLCRLVEAPGPATFWASILIGGRRPLAAWWAHLAFQKPIPMPSMAR